MRLALTALVSTGLAGVQGAALAAPQASGAQAFVGVNVVPMTGPDVLHDQTVIVRDGRITQVGPRDKVVVPSDAHIVGKRGAWVMPGLTDAHVHLMKTPQALDLFVANGITTIRDLSGRPEYLNWAKEIAEGKRVGPTLLMTGPIIHAQMGKPPLKVKIDTPEAARAEVDRQWNAGFRMIKPYTELKAEVYYAAVAEAKKHGMYVTGHIPDSVGLSGIIASGQDEIAHTEELRSEFMVGYDPTKMFTRWPMDASRIKPVAERIAKAGVTVVTSLSTLHALRDQTVDTKAVLARPEIAYQHPFATAEMRKPDYSYAHRLPADYLTDVIVPHFNKVVLGLEDAGARLIAGTDSGLPGVVWGWGTHQELQFLVEAGLTPYQALRTATVSPAEVLPGLKGQGVIQAGAPADLLVVAGNPLQDIRNTQKIVGVMKAGRWIDSRERARMLASAKAILSKTVVEDPFD